jgi:hypothetical protein
VALALFAISQVAVQVHSANFSPYSIAAPRGQAIASAKIAIPKTQNPGDQNSPVISDVIFGGQGYTKNI